jgi:oligosaccharyltransferase complex subunit gamma
MRLLSTFIALLALPLALALAASSDPRERLVKLAAAGNGIIKLDHKTYDLLTTPNRDWSTSILLTAMDKRRSCAPCK